MTHPNKERLISAHPVEPVVRTQILQQLQQIESRQNVRVLFACESGSRGWGFASPDSDYDVRFIYVNRLEWYLTVDPLRDVIELPINGDLDINGWDLRKTLQLLKRSNPTLLEWLASPIVYVQHDAETARLRSLARTYFSAERGHHHYLAMAHKNFRAYLQDEQIRYKKYLYVIRPLLAARWIYEKRDVPPMRFAELAAALLTDDTVIDEINRLLDLKMRSGEALTGPPWPRLHEFIKAEFAEAAQRHIDPETATASDALDAFLAEVACRDRFQQ